jgi:DNA-binding MarR family transcriptional regulator
MGQSANDELDLGAQLRSAVGRLYRRFRSERPEGGLGDAALAVLSRLHKRGPLTLTELSESDRVSPASMSQIVNRLTSAGYAVRTRSPADGRKVLFSATADGDELASAARAQRNAWLDERLRTLSAEDRAVIARAAALLSGIADSRQPLPRPSWGATRRGPATWQCGTPPGTSIPGSQAGLRQGRWRSERQRTAGRTRRAPGRSTPPPGRPAPR